MGNRLESIKKVFSVEGDTEKWYLDWLGKEINAYSQKTRNAIIDAKVCPNPRKYSKGVNPLATPRVYHICDFEGNEAVDIEKFRGILNELKNAKSQKNFDYLLGYSNLTFELWIILHKKDINRCLSNRKQYLKEINQVFDEHFASLDKFKEEQNFRRCLSKMSLSDVVSAVQRAEKIEAENYKTNKLCKFAGFQYYENNPALSVYIPIRDLLVSCGIIGPRTKKVRIKK